MNETPTEPTPDAPAPPEPTEPAPTEPTSIDYSGSQEEIDAAKAQSHADDAARLAEEHAEE